MVNIVLADDHKAVRKGIKGILSSEPDFSVVGEAENGLEAMKLVETLHPDILVLDLMMPGMNGLDVTRQLCKKKSHTVIVIISIYNNEAYVTEALRSGARAYVLKESSSDELVNAIREVLTGHCYLSFPFSGKLNEIYKAQDQNSKPRIETKK